MLTNNQLIKSNRKKKKHKNKSPNLKKCPQLKGLCQKIYTVSPKKPNSALRKVAKIKIYKTKKSVIALIPGIGHNLSLFCDVLIRGGRVRDLPGVKYKLIRNKYDLSSVFGRKTSRSKYGVKKI